MKANPTGTGTGLRLLAAILLLAALLTAAAAASAESADLSWGERMAQAREKYNGDTVHIYRKGRGGRKWGKFNICFYRSGLSEHLTISIPDSLKITDEAEMEAILEVVAENENYDEAVYGTVSFMKAEWIAHNLAHSMATGSEEERKLVEMIAGEAFRKVAARARDLDLSPIEEITAKERILYEFVGLLYSRSED